MPWVICKRELNLISVLLIELLICVIQILSVISDIGKLIQINLVVGDIENIQNWFWRIFSLETELWE